MSRNGILKTPKRKNNNLSKHQDPIEVYIFFIFLICFEGLFGTFLIFFLTELFC